MPGVPFRVHADQVGGTVAVDGVAVPAEALVAAEVVVQPGQATRLVLHLAADGLLDGVAGAVEVVRDGLTGDSVRALDPQAISAEVAKSAGFGTNTAALYLQVIADMLDRRAG